MIKKNNLQFLYTIQTTWEGKVSNLTSGVSKAKITKHENEEKEHLGWNQKYNAYAICLDKESVHVHLLTEIKILQRWFEGQKLIGCLNFFCPMAQDILPFK